MWWGMGVRVLLEYEDSFIVALCRKLHPRLPRSSADCCAGREGATCKHLVLHEISRQVRWQKQTHLTSASK